MRRRMENYLRSVKFKYRFNTLVVSYGTDKRDKIKVGKSCAEFISYIIRIVFVDVENYQLFRTESRNLSAKFASDRASASRDKHNFVVYVSRNVIHIKFYRVSAEQIFNFDFAQVVYMRGTFQNAVKPWDDFKNASRLLANVKNSRLFFSRCGRNGEPYLVNSSPFCIFDY